MVDCGADWLNAINSVSPTAIVLTHAHSDHAFGLAKGVSCPVYATDDTWSAISRFPIVDRRMVTHTSRSQAAECVSRRFR
jgi:glyoxylase-like metal-dependent hydrolase (beta-lactamase superfamily II)